ncbi:MAG: type III secretion system chaperone [Pseudomonadota bacterium]
MSRAHHVNDVLRNFGNEVGLEVELGKDDRTSLRFDDVLVTFAYRQQPIEMLWIYADLGPIPKNGTMVPSLLLELNLHCWLGSVMTISTDRSGTRAVGHNMMPLPTLDAASFKAVLKAMLDATVQIRDLLARAEQHAPGSPGGYRDAQMPKGSLRV